MRKKRSINVREYYLSLFSLGLLVVMAILSGCGGDNASAPPIETGTFVDGPVAGLNYSTATLSGVTGADGSFQYRTGESITFSAGEIVLGATVGKSVISPNDLSSGVHSSASAKSVNISRFLQLIDVDADHTNGIEITEGIRGVLVWDDADGENDGSIFNDETSIFRSTGTFAVFLENTLTTLKSGSVFTAETDRTGTTRSATGSRRNLNSTLTSLAAHPFSPYVKEVGIGVTDLNASMTFYGNVMGLQFVEYNGRTDRVEATYEDNRSSNTNKLTLMQFNDSSINCTNQPVKIVYAVPSCETCYTAITTGGGAGFSPCTYQAALGATVGMALDPDGYLIELIEVSYLPATYMSGIGLGVGSLQPVDDFYTRVIGMKFNYYLYVAYFMNEVILQSPLSTTVSYGMDIVLMDYFNDTGRVYTNVPAKITFTVADPAAASQAVANEGLQIIQSPSSGVRAVAKDPNGYEVEFVAAGG